MNSVFRRGHLVTALVALGLASLMLLAQPMVIIGSLGGVQRASGAPLVQAGPWNAAALPAIAGVSDAAGTRPPLAGDIVDMRRTGLATSTRPILTATFGNANANGRGVRFQIRSADDRRVLPNGLSAAITVAGGVARWTVPRGVLEPFHAYRMAVVDAGDGRAVIGSRPLNVDTQRAREQQQWNSGGLRVAKVTGEPVLALASPVVQTLSGPSGFEMRFQPSNPGWKGLPPGWVIQPAGATSRWVSLTLDGAAGGVTLRQMDGFSVTFVPTGAAGAYAPLVGPHHQWPGGSYADLSRNGDGSFTVVDVNSTVTLFPAPPAGAGQAVLHPTRAWAEGSPAIQQSWKSGRLALLTDPVSRRSIRFSYAPSAQCAAPAEGFVAPPAGMLCTTRDWAGQTMRFSYVRTADGVQLGRVSIDEGAGSTAAVLDVGWTPDGLPARLRQPLAAAAVASGVVAGLGAQDTRAMTQVRYDGTGRVASITKPAGLVSGSEQTDAQQEQTTQSFQYRADAQGQVTFVVRQSGVRTPDGIVHQAVANASTMNETQTVSADGCRLITTFNDDDDAREVRNSCDNTRETHTYGANGQAVETRGPTRAPINSPTVPLIRSAYDTTAESRTSRNVGTPLTGLMMLTFNDPSLAGAPSTRSVGPVVGGVRPARMAINFDGNPSGAGGDWGARLSGDYIAPLEGAFRFRALGNGVQLSVNGRACSPAPCTISLGRGDRAHIQSSLRAEGAAGIELQVERPGGGFGPIPARDLSPALLQVTEQWTVDQLSRDGSATHLKNSFEYDNEAGGQIVKETSSQGTVMKYAFRPYTGKGGNYGQLASFTNPRNKTTTQKHWGGTQKATGCAGSAGNQGGLLKTQVTSGMPGSKATVYDSAGRLQNAAGAGTTICVRRDASGGAVAGTVTGAGDAFGLGSDSVVGGNPLVSTATVTLRGVTSTGTQEVAIDGTLHRATDWHGTVTTYEYDPATGSPLRITTRTAKGQERTRTFEYGDFNRMTALAIDGAVLQRTTYRNDGYPERVEYANGTAATVELDQNNNVSARTYAGFAGGATVREENTFSRGGSVLARTLSAPDGTVNFAYAYNKDHRLTLSSTSGTLPVSTRSSRMDFSGLSGANGNRQKETRVARDGATSTFAYSYDGADALISSTKPGLGPLAYNAQRRATRVGETSVAYDAAGNVTGMSGPLGRMQFLGNGDTEFVPAGGGKVLLRPSGDLLLDQDGMIAAQLVPLSQGVSVGIDASGQPVQWAYDDLQGSTAWRTTGNDAPGATTVYDPWGEQIAGPARQAPASPLDLAMSMEGWAGTSRLPIGDDLYTMGARQYAPRAGRFVQPDPLGESVNTWEFVGGDPLNGRDPSGERMTVGQGVALGIALVFAAVIAIKTAGVGAPAVAVKISKLKLAMLGAAAAVTGDVAQQLIDKPVAKFDPIQTSIRLATSLATSGVQQGAPILWSKLSAAWSASAPALADQAAAAAASPVVDALNDASPLLAQQAFFSGTPAGFQAMDNAWFEERGFDFDAVDSDSDSVWDDDPPSVGSRGVPSASSLRSSVDSTDWSRFAPLTR